MDDKAKIISLLKSSVNDKYIYIEEVVNNEAFKEYRKLKDILKTSKDKYTASFHDSDTRDLFLDLLGRMYVDSKKEREAICEAKDQLAYGFEIVKASTVENFSKSYLDSFIKIFPDVKKAKDTLTTVIGNERSDGITRSMIMQLLKVTISSVDALLKYLNGGGKYEKNVKEPLEKFVKDIMVYRNKLEVGVFNDWLMRQCKTLQENTKKYIKYRNDLMEEAGIEPSIEYSVFLRVLYSIAGVKTANSKNQDPGGLLYRLTLNTCLDEPKEPTLEEDKDLKKTVLSDHKSNKNLKVLKDYYVLKK